MSLQQHYDNLWSNSRQQFEAGAFELDPLLDATNDERRGITLLFRPVQEVRNEFLAFLEELKAVEPEQHYYPSDDLHVTVMSIISCYAGFQLEMIQVEDYLSLLKEALQGIGPFRIQFKGLTASPSCVIIQGFPADESLQEIRERLRKAFAGSPLQQTLDQRYTIQTAHSTVSRFRKPLLQPQKFLKKLELYRQFDFGSSEVTELELVFNDWYQRSKEVRLLGKWKLR
ncbi:2'-5' RNA ligase superfamily protein [Pontibacter ummariensis]|uniref:2'-5' RNA ligase superfamily protein n=1 Tax=Pontibacter ummariensis TaxID=1610492 RepID=A0A239GKP0_9BACT|nr:2'-5' RNA ligase family protein [Pontibacter ummariensis]PRY11273.1 2'-5' RNA ligase superfamily protein [Pontibacter ummariensis]SNS68624.1 2'-5' RNA ligase superfamily protein [Pontibacter ummariensis]